MNLEVSRGVDLASKFSEESPVDTIGVATPFRCHGPCRAELISQSNRVDLRSLAQAALPNVFRA